MLIEIHEACKVSHLPQTWFRLCNLEKGEDGRYYNNLLKYSTANATGSLKKCTLKMNY